MKGPLSLLIAALCGAPAQAQNLVPNWSFEDLTQCPSLFNQIQLATGWNKILLNNVPPHHVDYFHTCGTGSFQAPDGFWGYQQPSTGQAYAGISTRSPLAPDYRENIYAELIQPLTPGAFYTISMKVSHTDLSEGATNNLGIKLATTPDFPINNSSHLYSTTVLDDHINWVTLTTSFFADSAYAYIAVGNFHTDANTTVTTVCPSCPYVHNEYYIDDICILPHTDNGDPVFCDIPFVPATTGIAAMKVSEVGILNNVLGPGEQVVRITGLPGGTSQLSLMDATGRIVAGRSAVQGPGFEWEIGGLAPGSYLLLVAPAQGPIRSARLFITR